MPQLITDRKTNTTIESLIKEVRKLRIKIDKFMGIVPKESIKEYENMDQIKKDYSAAIKSRPSQ